MLKGLQGLRALAMLGIFFFHSGILLKGTFPVTFFFMLSGFVLYYNYNSKVSSINIKESILWGFKRIKKLYPIHIITFIMSIFIRMDWILKFSVNDVILKGFLNIFLIQSLSINHNKTFNAASWFLSTLVICYLVALPLIYLVKQLNNIKPTVLILGILGLKLILLLIVPMITNIEYSQYYFFYISPYSRILDILLGMVLAKLFIFNKDYKFKRENTTVYEVSLIGLFAVMYIGSFFISGNFLTALYYAPIFSVGLVLIAYEKGAISKFLCNDLFQKVAAFSFEFYMVHELILMIFRKVFASLEYHWLIRNIIIAIPSFIISIILAYLLNKFVTNRKKLKVYNSVKVQG